MNAQQMLDAARKSNPGATYGTFTHGSIIVSYCRPDSYYDVGTAAQSHVKGKRSVVLPVLAAMLAAVEHCPTCGKPR